MSRPPAMLAAAILWSASVGACSALMPEVGTVRVAEDVADARDAADGTAHDSATDAGPMTLTVIVGRNDSHTFTPATLRARVGDTVRWVWEVSGHTVTSGVGGNADGLFCSPANDNCSAAPTSGTGATYDHVFSTAGTFAYFCRPHFDSGMVGSIIVE